MHRVKEVVNWIINYNMYCILNIYGDSQIREWFHGRIENKDRFLNIWLQIAEEFKDYDEI